MKSTNRILALLTLIAMLVSIFAGCALAPCEEHIDANKDGICDECEETIDKGCTKHRDANDDGKCDNAGCGASYTDGCDKHSDKNDDSKCDTAGCGITYTDGCDSNVCYDNDGDGKCDNNGCDKPVSGGSDSGESTSYTVTVTSAGGMKMSGVKVYLFDGSNLEKFATTDENGACAFDGIAAKDYKITLSGVPKGYNVQESYSFTSGKAEIVISSSVITSGAPTGGYKLGDVMYDFEVTDTTGKTHRLSEILKTKKAVLINFWFSTCGPCVNEFPYMNSAYQQFSDDIEIVALNNSDTLDEIKVFQSQMGLTFPCVKDYTALESYFGVSGWPTSVIVDRYGVICLIETGGLTSERPFTAAFDHFTADNYEQKLLNSFDDLTPTEKPIYQMPSSDEIKDAFVSGNVNIDFTIYKKDGEVEEYAWPFVVETVDGRKCIMSSNYNREGSYAQIFAYVTLKAGEAVAFDYYAQTELSTDYLYVLVDGKDIYAISGISTAWESCYPFVATEDGVYEIAFIYLKDNDISEGKDRVYLDNLRIVDESAIDKETYIPRFAATKTDDNGFSYKEYAEIVFNEKDGYYHVGTKDGPILLANLMGVTRFNTENSIYNMAYGGEISLNGVITAQEYYDRILPYFSCASNSALNGYCSVTEELMELLKIANAVKGSEPKNDKAWLKICSYYDAYGTDGEQLEDPIKGLKPFSAYEATLGSDNKVYYNRVIMPRGLWYRFTPTVSGVYRITSDSDYEVNAWIFLEDGTQYHEYWACEKGYFDELNVSMVVYLEAGVDYYIDIAFYDVYQVGAFTFEVKYEAESYDYLRLASPGFFTYYENEETGASDLNHIISGGIDIIYNPHTGYYHQDLGKNSSGEQIYGSILYVDFKGGTTIFSHSIEEMIIIGGFNFAVSESDQEILSYIAKYKTEEATRAYLKTIWGDAYDEYAAIYQIDEIFAGIYHGDTETGNKTEAIRPYLDRLYTEDDVEDERLVGCVAVDAELAEILQCLMDKFTFEGVEYSWAKLAYFYEHLGPQDSANE